MSKEANNSFLCFLDRFCRNAKWPVPILAVHGRHQITSNRSGGRNGAPRQPYSPADLSAHAADHDAQAPLIAVFGDQKPVDRAAEQREWRKSPRESPLTTRKSGPLSPSHAPEAAMSADPADC